MGHESLLIRLGRHPTRPLSVVVRDGDLSAVRLSCRLTRARSDGLERYGIRGTRAIVPRLCP